MRRHARSRAVPGKQRRNRARRVLDVDTASHHQHPGRPDPRLGLDPLCQRPTQDRDVRQQMIQPATCSPQHHDSFGPGARGAGDGQLEIGFVLVGR